MKRKLDPRWKLARVRHPFGNAVNDFNAAYRIMGPAGRDLTILVSDGEGWDHVSVSTPAGTDAPTWAEMCWVKDQFFEAREYAVEYHPPHERYINVHPNCLHIWRPQNERVPMPPLALV